MEPPALDPQSGERVGVEFGFVLGVIGRFWLLILSTAVIAVTVLVVMESVQSASRSALVYQASVELGIEPLALAMRRSENRPEISALIVTFDDLLRRMDMNELSSEVSAAWEAETLPEASRVRDSFSVTVLSGEPEALVVTATMPERDSAIRLAEIAADSVASFNDQLLRRNIAEAQVFVENELEALARSLERATTSELNYLNTHGANTYDDVSRQLRDDERALEETYAMRNQLLAEQAHVESEIARVHASLPDSFGRFSDSLVTDLFAELQELLKRELNMAMIYQPGYPPLQRLREEIAEKELTISEAMRRYEESNPAGLDSWSYLIELRTTNNRLLGELSGLEARERSIRDRTRLLAQELPGLVETAQEYSRIAFEVEGFRKEYNHTLDLDLALRSAIRAGFGRLEPLGPTRVSPLKPEPPDYFRSAFIGASLGFLVGLGLALLLEAADTSIRSERDALTHLNEPIIGTIPDMNRHSGGRRRALKRSAQGDAESRIGPSVVTAHEPKSPISEAYRTLRTNFQFGTITHPPKTVLVTSSVPAEGKTTTSVNLAVTMAQNGTRVLLVDADMRRPHVHYVLGTDRSPGLSEVLAGTADVHDVIRTTPVSNLMVVPSGTIPNNPAELIGSARGKALLEELSGEFDLVVFDLPAVLVVTDALLLARHVDSVIMVVAVHNARRHTILRAMRLLRTSGCNITGIVLNGIKPHRLRHYYYYYYYEDESRPKRRRWYHE